MSAAKGGARKKNLLTAAEWKKIEDANRRAERERDELQLVWLPDEAPAQDEGK